MRNEVKVHRPMFNPDTNPLRQASGTTAGTAATVLTWVLLVPGLVTGLMACAEARADDANEEILLGGLRARITI